MDLKGRTAIVTGGGSGICLAFTTRLLQKGCNVVIADLHLSEEADRALSDVRSDHSGVELFVRTDVADWAQLQKLFDTAVEKFGRVDIVCPGAGLFEPPWSSFWGFGPNSKTVDTVDRSTYRILDINITHPIRCTQLAIDQFLKQAPLSTGSPAARRGHVVHISSIAAQTVNPVVPLYLTSKAAVSQFVRSMGGIEEGFGIRVNAVAPANTRTPLWKTCNRVYVDENKGDVFVEPGEIADVMIKLIIEEEYGPGTIWEVGKGSVRKVELFNDPGPDMTKDGFGIADHTEVVQGHLDALSKFGK